MEYMDFEEWKKRSKRLKRNYVNYVEIAKDCDKVFDKHYAIEILQPNILCVKPFRILVDYEEDLHPTRDYVYYKFEGETKDVFNLQKLDTEKLVNQLASKLSEYVSVKDLIEDVLNELDVTEVIDVFDRAIVRKGKIKSEEGCYQLKVYGKRGHPRVLNLR